MLEKKLTVAAKKYTQSIHWHDLLEVNFVLQGEAEIMKNNKVFKVGTGELMVINRDDVHSITEVSDNLMYIQMHLDTQYFDRYIPNIWTAFFYCTPEENDIISMNLKAEIKSNISKIVKLMKEQKSTVDAESKIKYYSIDILGILKMGFLATRYGDEQKINDNQINRIWKVIDYIYDNYDRKLTLHEVAQQVYISDDYLTRILKKVTGYSFEEFLGFVRAEMSLRMLLSTDLSITDISYQCGFSAPRYYNTAFVKFYESTPTEYRKKNKKNFLIQKQIVAESIIFDDKIDKEKLAALLKQYEIEYANSKEIREIDIVIDHISDCGIVAENPVILKLKDNSVWSFNIQKAVADIGVPYVQIEKDLYAWEEKGSIKLFVINQETCKKEYRLKFTGFDPKNKYIYCYEKSRDIPETILKIIDAGMINKLDRAFVSNIFSTEAEYGEIYDEDHTYMSVELNNNCFSKIVIQKI